MSHFVSLWQYYENISPCNWIFHLLEDIQSIAPCFRRIKYKCVVNVNDPLVVCGAHVREKNPESVGASDMGAEVEEAQETTYWLHF